MSSAYHPQTDGQTEVVNKSVGTYLRCFASQKQREWVKFLPWAEYWYNTCYHSATKTTPFQVLYGRDPPRLIPYEKGTSPAQRVDEELAERDQVLKELTKQLAKSQQIMKDQKDKHRRDVNYNVGDLVYIKIQPGRQQSLRKQKGYKLAPKYFGPYKIIRRIGQVAYRLKLPDESQIYPVFHASQLKPCHGQLRPNEVHRLRWFYGYKPRYIPEELNGVREGVNGLEVLLRWKDLPIEEETWEPLEYIDERFPDFELKAKVTFWRGSDQPEEAFASAKAITATDLMKPQDLADKVHLKGAGVGMKHDVTRKIPSEDQGQTCLPDQAIRGTKASEDISPPRATHCTTKCPCLPLANLPTCNLPMPCPCLAKLPIKVSPQTTSSLGQPQQGSQ